MAPTQADQPTPITTGADSAGVERSIVANASSTTPDAATIIAPTPASQGQQALTSESELLAAAPPYESFTLHDVPSNARTDELETIRTDNGKRSAIYITCSGPVKDAYERAIHIVAGEGYSMKPYNDEVIWKKGVGLATAMHYITLTPMKNHLYVQGWVMMGIGSAAISEMPLTGFVGAIPKSSVKKTIALVQNVCGNRHS